ncbi:flagellar basal body rod protein FlgB [bacterium]|nr:flagellar basal body rod protein FlgB [bacterium]
MMNYNFLSRTGIGRLKTALDAYALRQSVTAQNIANVQTPGYEAKHLSFEKNLNRALTNQLKMTPVRQPPGSIPISFSARSPLKLEKNNEEYFNGVNNVNIEKEMVILAKTTLSYRMVTKITNGVISKLRSAITGKVG